MTASSGDAARSADHWPSGVGGVQCDECGQTTIVRYMGSIADGDDGEWLCSRCWYGDHELIDWQDDDAEVTR